MVDVTARKTRQCFAVIATKALERPCIGLCPDFWPQMMKDVQTLQ